MLGDEVSRNIACPPAVDPENHVSTIFMSTIHRNRNNMVSRHVTQFVHFKSVMMELLQHYLAQKRFIIQHQKEEQTCRCVFFITAVLLTTA